MLKQRAASSAEMAPPPEEPSERPESGPNEFRTRRARAFLEDLHVPMNSHGSHSPHQNYMIDPVSIDGYPDAGAVATYLAGKVIHLSDHADCRSPSPTVEGPSKAGDDGRGFDDFNWKERAEKGKVLSYVMTPHPSELYLSFSATTKH